MQLSNARYQGVDDKNQPYTVTADKVRQEDLDSSFVNLEGPKADIMMADQSWAAVTALTGVFNREDQILSLAGNVNFFHDLGYEIRTESAQLDIVRGQAHGKEHVEGQGPFGQFDAEGVRCVRSWFPCIVEWEVSGVDLSGWGPVATNAFGAGKRNENKQSLFAMRYRRASVRAARMRVIRGRPCLCNGPNPYCRPSPGSAGTEHAAGWAD